MSEDVSKVRISKVWKIGSRWSYDGSSDTSVYSIFEKNNVVFLGYKGKEFKEKVSCGDFFAIADGFTIKAIAKAISEPMELETLLPNLERNEEEKSVFSYNENKKVIGCRVIFFPLGDKRFSYKRRGSFHSANKYWSLIKSLYEDIAKEKINDVDYKFYDLCNIKKLNWLPWIGDNYFSSEKRLLLIGESHYMTPKFNSPNYTRNVVLENCIDDITDKQPFFRNIRYSLLNTKQKSVKKIFWNTVSFYNFVQRPMNDLHKRPTETDYLNGWEIFLEIIKILKPTDIIFWGTEALSYCPKNILEKKELTKVGRYKSYEAKILDDKIDHIKIFGVRHPSSFFSWKKWNSFFCDCNPDLIEYLEGEILSFTKMNN